MTDLIPLQFQNEVELWCVSTLRKPFSTLKKFLLKTVSDGAIFPPQDGVFFAILPLVHTLK